MISPWNIYWVMQLDTIGLATGLIGTAGFLAIPLLWAYVLDRCELTGRVVASCLSLIWAAILTAAIFLPSSKTAAAMIIIPAIASNERIQAEAGDLYELAKQGLKKLVADDEADRPATEGQ